MICVGQPSMSAATAVDADRSRAAALLTDAFAFPSSGTTMTAAPPSQEISWGLICWPPGRDEAGPP